MCPSRRSVSLLLNMVLRSHRITVAGAIHQKSFILLGAAFLSAHWVPFVAMPADLLHMEGQWRRNAYIHTSYPLVYISHGLFQMHYEDEKSHGEVRLPTPW